jgi:hypothetical protein
MIRIETVVDSDIIKAYRDLARDMPKVTQKAFKGIVQRYSTKMLKELSTEPGKPRYPLRWKSARQRRYVMAKLRREGNLPYQRTHKLARGWRVDTKATGNEGYMRVYNDVPSAVFVQGDFAQPMHLDTGWPQAAEVFVKYEELMVDDLIQTWYALVEFKG